MEKIDLRKLSVAERNSRRKLAISLHKSGKNYKTIAEIIAETILDQLKLSYGLWKRKAVKKLIEREFGIVLALSTMGKYSHKWGFSPQKPKKRAYEQNSKLVQKWIDE